MTVSEGVTKKDNFTKTPKRSQKTNNIAMVNKTGNNTNLTSSKASVGGYKQNKASTQSNRGLNTFKKHPKPEDVKSNLKVQQTKHNIKVRKPEKGNCPYCAKAGATEYDHAVFVCKKIEPQISILNLKILVFANFAPWLLANLNYLAINVQS